MRVNSRIRHFCQTSPNLASRGYSYRHLKPAWKIDTVVSDSYSLCGMTVRMGYRVMMEYLQLCKKNGEFLSLIYFMNTFMTSA